MDLIASNSERRARSLGDRSETYDVKYLESGKRARRLRRDNVRIPRRKDDDQVLNKDSAHNTEPKSSVQGPRLRGSRE